MYRPNSCYTANIHTQGWIEVTGDLYTVSLWLST